MTNGGLELGGVRVVGDGDDDLDVVGRRPPLELGLGLDHELDAGVGVAFYHTFDPNERFHL